MGVKSDEWIIEQAKKGMIQPFEKGQISNGVISFGVSSYGYDMRIADEFKIFTNVHSAIVDPKNFSEKSFVDYKGDVCIIPANSFALGKSIEYFNVPREVLCIVLGKKHLCQGRHHCKCPAPRAVLWQRNRITYVRRMEEIQWS